MTSFAKRTWTESLPAFVGNSRSLMFYFFWLNFPKPEWELEGEFPAGRDFSQGSVVFVPDGLLLKNLNAREERNEIAECRAPPSGPRNFGL